MKTNWTDIICKLMTWYKDCHIEVVPETVYNLPILKLVDDRMGTEYKIYSMDMILNSFKAMGLTRICYTGTVNK